nr:xylulose kinase-1 [Tanacetum cinerariifolium]
MVAILEKTEHNTDFHQIMDFLEASHIRYALTVRPTVYVSHIRQFWSIARVETTNGETQILAMFNGRQRTVSESSIKRHLKLNDEGGQYATKTLGIDGYLYQLAKATLTCRGKGSESRPGNHSVEDQSQDLLGIIIPAVKSSFLLNFISSSDLLCWNIILKGNSAKSMTTDKDGNLKIHPPVTAKEHQQVQREEKARTILLSALPDEHMGDFYHMINARDILNTIKARFGGNVESKKMQKSLLKQKFKEFKIFEEEGLDKGYDKMQKILSQMNTLMIKPEPEDFLEIDTKGYSSSSSTLSNVAFVSTVGSSQGKLSYQESRNDGYGGYTTTLSTSPGSSSSKGSSKSKCNVVDDVIYSF